MTGLKQPTLLQHSVCNLSLHLLQGFQLVMLVVRPMGALLLNGV